MTKLGSTNPPIRRSGNQYRLIIMNEDTYEEVVKFKLSKWSVYAALSTIFVLLVLLTASIIIFTPLKYYLPGSATESASSVREYRNLKMRADSIELALKQKDQYFNNLKKVLTGKVPIPDTTMLPVSKSDNNEQPNPKAEK